MVDGRVDGCLGVFAWEELLMHIGLCVLFMIYLVVKLLQHLRSRLYAAICMSTDSRAMLVRLNPRAISQNSTH